MPNIVPDLRVRLCYQNSDNELDFRRDSLCFINFDVIIRQSSIWFANFFFSRANEIKTRGLVQQLILGMLRDLILQLRDFLSLNGEPPL